MGSRSDQVAHVLKLMLQAFQPAKHGGEAMADRAVGAEVFHGDTTRGGTELTQLEIIKAQRVLGRQGRRDQDL